MKRSLITLCALPVLAVLTGCHNHVIFSTHTSAGLDVSGTAQYPDKVSFSYNRQEVAIVPRKTNGEAHSVFGGMDSDISFMNGSVIKQTFATGDAAVLASGGVTNPPVGTTDPSKAPLVFMTATTFGLHLTAGESQMSPNLLMGYRRAEAAMIPVPDSAQEVRPVYADILINTKSLKQKDGTTNPALALTTNFPSISGVRIKQSFATGRAAVNLAATNHAVRQKLKAAAGAAGPTLSEARALDERTVEERVGKLSAEKQKALYVWADASFPRESGGKLASENSVSEFINGFVPQLDTEKLARVEAKLSSLETP